jgi:cell division control protein 6
MTRFPLLRSDQTLFRHPDAFEPAFVPDHLHHRDAQTQELARASSGPPSGAGALSPRLPGDREDHHRPPDLFRGHEETQAGRYLDDVKEGIAARLQDRNAALVVCLDDADELLPAGTYNTLLYQILRLYEKWDVRKAAVFAVTSDLGLNLGAEADPSVWSVFHPTEITFLPYTKTEIREILADRVRQGLYPRVISKVLLDRIAGIAAGEQDIRIGIDLVRAAVLRAEKDGRRRVGSDDVTAAARAVTAPALRNRAGRLSAGERALACWIAKRSHDGADMASGTVFEAAQEYLPVGKTTYHEHLNALTRAGIVDLVPRTGREREVRLRYDAGDVVTVCRCPDQTCKNPD